MAISPPFDTARRSLTALETALGVVANNIANANTPGYTRQVPVFQSDRATLTAAGYPLGRGVHIESIDQVADPLIQDRLIRAQSEQAGLATKHDRLQELSAVLGDLQSPSLSGQVSAFFDAADALALNPGGLAERENLLGTAHALAVEFNRRSTNVATLQRTVDDRLLQGVSSANDAIQRIASLNTLIVSQEANGANANDLRDERSRALESLAKQLPVGIQEQSNGALRVYARDGTVLVDEGVVLHTVATVNGSSGFDGAAVHVLGFTDGATFLVPPNAFRDGELGQLASVRDTDIVRAQQNLDTVANNLRTEVNAVQQAGTDLDGNATAAVPLFTGTSAADIAVAITDPRRVGAALTTQPGDNANALALADLRTKSVTALGGASFGNYLAVEQGRIGEAATLAGDQADSATLVTTQLQTERSSLSGVNVNEELINLLKYQRAYQASAQVVNVANTMLDELFQIV